MRNIKGRLAWIFRDLGWALIHAGDKFDGEEPLSLDAEFEAGHRVGHRAGRRSADAAEGAGLA